MSRLRGISLLAVSLQLLLLLEIRSFLLPALINGMIGLLAVATENRGLSLLVVVLVTLRWVGDGQCLRCAGDRKVRLGPGFSAFRGFVAEPRAYEVSGQVARTRLK